MSKNCEDCTHYLGTVAFSKNSRVTPQRMCGYYGYPYVCERFAAGSPTCSCYESIKPQTVSWEEARAAMKEGKKVCRHYGDDEDTGANISLIEGTYYVANTELNYMFTEDDFEGQWVILDD